ncbi:hypothetical protein Tco_1244670 [Tanacetum coccineum]
MLSLSSALENVIFIIKPNPESTAPFSWACISNFVPISNQNSDGRISLYSVYLQNLLHHFRGKDEVRSWLFVCGRVALNDWCQSDDGLANVVDMCIDCTFLRMRRFVVDDELKSTDIIADLMIVSSVQRCSMICLFRRFVQFLMLCEQFYRTCQVTLVVDPNLELNASGEAFNSFIQLRILLSSLDEFRSREKLIKKLLSITSKPVVGMIYENSKKEKRVTILKEISKFCDATLKRVLEMVKKFNKDVKYGYVNPSPSDAYTEYLEFYEEYIEDRLKHRDQMRHWEPYVNGRPLGSRTEPS